MSDSPVARYWWKALISKDHPVKDGLLAAAAPYSIARRGAAAQRLKHELSHMSDTTSSSIKWHEDKPDLIIVSHGRYNLSNGHV